MTMKNEIKLINKKTGETATIINVGKEKVTIQLADGTTKEYKESSLRKLYKEVTPSDEPAIDLEKDTEVEKVEEKKVEKVEEKKVEQEKVEEKKVEKDQMLPNNFEIMFNQILEYIKTNEFFEDSSIKMRTPKFAVLNTKKSFAQIVLQKKNIKLNLKPSNNYLDKIKVRVVPKSFGWSLNTQFTILEKDKIEDIIELLKISHDVKPVPEIKNK